MTRPLVGRASEGPPWASEPLYWDFSLSYDSSRPARLLDIGHRRHLGESLASPRCPGGYWFVRIWKFIVAVEVM